MRSSTWSCTPATSLARLFSTTSCSDGGPRRSTPAVAHTRRSRLGERIGGGVVECDTGHPLWLPYVEVTDISEGTEHARLRGVSVTLDAREGPAGWRSVLDVPAGGEIALWQPKARALGPPTKRRR